MTYAQRLIEVDLPIKRISAHARREKSIRHGHISTLHIWWARRPLAACRAVLCATLWPDTADPLCPEPFRHTAADLIQSFARKVMTSARLVESCSSESLGRWNTLARPDVTLDPANPAHLNNLRYALLDFIADFANWDNSTVKEYLDTARALTQAAHEALGGAPGTRPLVVDPFAGGGSIPLEALRVGADAFASDLNPVAVLLNKVVLEYIPKHGQRLADEVRKWGEWVKQEAEKELAEFYPKEPDGATPIAYLWARTITCEGPGCGAEVPLIRSLWLAKKSRQSVALRLVPDVAKKRVGFEIVHDARIKDVGEGTVRRGAAICPICGYATCVESVRRQLKLRSGGAQDARLMCVVKAHPVGLGRLYCPPSKGDFDSVQSAAAEIERQVHSYSGPLSLLPDEDIPLTELRRISAPIYGLNKWADLFTPRQSLALGVLAQLVHSAGRQIEKSDAKGLADAVQAVLALVLDRQADKLSSLSRWDCSRENPQGTFGRQALPMVWDFDEVNPISGSGGDWDTALSWVVQVIGRESTAIPAFSVGEAHTLCSSATVHPLPDDAAQVFITDPPYYDSVPYAHLSDFFYVWLHRTLGAVYPDLFSAPLAPKSEEIVVDRPHSLSLSNHDVEYYERELTQAFSEARRILAPSGIGSIVFASLSTTSWEAIIQAVIQAGWTITGSWPIDTEMTSRLASMGQSRLMSSVHLVCRPREHQDDSTMRDSIGDWRDVLAELPGRIHDWLPRLADEGVVGADAIFACLGPALEIFSRYSRVEKPSGEPVPLKEFMERVWAAVAREALNTIFEGADTSGFEEDARLTAIWFWVLRANANGHESSINPSAEDDEEDEETAAGEKPANHRNGAGYSMEYDAARKLAQGLGADLGKLSQPGGIITIKGHTATLNSVAKRQNHLLGQQLSLFDNAGPTYSKSAHAEEKTHYAKLQPVISRQMHLFAERADVQTDPDQPFLPLFKPTGDDRPLMARLQSTGITTLDRLHQAMLLFGRSQASLLGPFLIETHAGEEEGFWRLAQALSALYPPQSEEKRWVDGVLARKKSLGF